MRSRARGRAPRARLRILRRPSVGAEIYDIVARARGFDQAHIAVPLCPFGSVNAWTTFELTNPEEAADMLDRASDNYG
jgi:hypothetical protein